MFQQPVAKELRSFQSLSKFTGLPQKRSVIQRRQSMAASRRHSGSRRRRNDSNTEEMSSIQAYGVEPCSSADEQPVITKRVSVALDDRPETKHQQVEWQEEAAFYIDDDTDLPYPGFVEPALGCLKQTQAPRSWALQMVMNPWFDRLTMLVILLNCITLGMYRPCEDGADCTTYRCYVLNVLDHMIFAYFAAEMLIKITALGFYGDSAYLSDTWNRLDFFIVVAGIGEYLLDEYLGNINLTAIRTIRVLRPLRAVNLNLLLDTLPMLSNVLLLCFFVFFIFGIIGVQLWAGLLRNRCVINLPKTNFTSDITDIVFENVTLTRYYIPEDTSLDYICSQSDASGLHTCQNLPPYIDNGMRCNLTLDEYDKVTNESCINWNIYYNECRVMHKNPFQGSVSFDNIGFAWVAIFLVISLEGWTDIMYYVQDAHSFWNWIYFVLLIVIGAFFMINLCLVVIATQFAETKRRETERMLQERKRMRSCGSLTSSDQGLATSSREGGGDSVYAAIVRLIGHWFRRSKRFIAKQWSAYRIRNRASKIPVDTLHLELRSRASDASNDCKDGLLRAKNGQKREDEHNRRISIGMKSNGSIKGRRNSHKHVNNSLEHWDVGRLDEPAELMEGDETAAPKSRRSGHRRKYSDTSSEAADEVRHSDTRWNMFRLSVKRFANSNHFTRGILVAILINTVSMGIEHHQQPELLTITLEYTNYFFTGLFAFEMLLKIISDGLFGYLADGFNMFDGCIVVLSVLELFQEGKGGLSVLRTFRLLRILKLVRFMPALRYQLVVMLKTMDNVTVFFGLLVLFIFIFSILGMNLFGCKFCKIDENAIEKIKRCERKNFDTLLWAILGMEMFGCKFCNHDRPTGCQRIEDNQRRMHYDSLSKSMLTTFQILTQEDWNMVLFNGMAQTTPWAALYFVALMTFGNYVLFNLLVAILVEGFQESKEEEKRKLEEEARKHAEFEQSKQQQEIKELLFTTTSKPYIEARRSVSQCTCPAENLSNLRVRLQQRQRTRSSVSDADRFLRGLRDLHHNHHRHLSINESRHAEPLLLAGSNARHSISPLRTIAEPRRDLFDRHINERIPNRLMRHTSLVLPSDSQFVDEIRPENHQRQRMNSWSGLHSLLNPNCPIHGRRALIEAYAMNKYLKMSQELSQALAEQERSEVERTNSRWNRFIRKTWIHTRADCSLYIFSPKNKIRIQSLRITQKKWFDYTILAFIGINCITLAMERPSIPPKSMERMFLNVSGYIFTVIFTIEMTMKVIANGFFIGKNSYFKDGWNILDGILVIISLINLLMEYFVSGDSPKIFGVIRVLRLLRALRPLRVINRAPGVKLVVMTLISSLKPIGNIVLICCTFFIIFGILGVQLFKGMMYHCVGADIANVTTRADCEADPRNKWTNQRYNFDNLGQALMSLFVLSSKDGWVSIMYQGIDAVGVDVQPIENYNEWRMIYFISFLLLVGFFVLNMFVGVVVENFHKCKEALEAEMKEKARKKRMERQIKRQEYERNCPQRKKKKRLKTQPYFANYGPTRSTMHSIITSKYFDLAIAAVIGINVISMAMEFYMMPPGLKYVLRALNYFFTAVFTLEAAVKLYALGIRRFFRERWNQLDMFIVILSIAGIIFEEFEALELPINPTIIRVMRVLRIARVLKLLKMAKGIRSLLDTVGEALPQVGNLGSLFFLLFFIFAALGVELFGKLECSEEHPCDGLGEHAHFKNFGMAFLTLFRIATGDNWNGIMKDALRDDCDKSDSCQRNCCVDPILAPCFFVIFVLISQFVLVNVVVAVLMKHLEESNKRDQDAEAQNAVDADLNRTDTDVEADTDAIPEEKEDVSLANIERNLIEVEEQLVEEVLDEDESEDEIPADPSPTRSNIQLYQTERPLITGSLRAAKTYNATHEQLGPQSLSLRSTRSAAHSPGNIERSSDSKIINKLSTSSFLRDDL
ncbi:Voltage-dependent calcium channel T type alpha-1 [Aphelenchoides besseyi]|nr:Voltage-dependent calcium channel T type alpha-1 [Aphelenchoides besseyi]